jgi:hypothetical protein
VAALDPYGGGVEARPVGHPTMPLRQHGDDHQGVEDRPLTAEPRRSHTSAAWRASAAVSTPWAGGVSRVGGILAGQPVCDHFSHVGVEWCGGA